MRRDSLCGRNQFQNVLAIHLVEINQCSGESNSNNFSAYCSTLISSLSYGNVFTLFKKTYTALLLNFKALLKKHPLNLLNNIQKDLNQIVISTLFTQVNDLEIKAELFK